MKDITKAALDEYRALYNNNYKPDCCLTDQQLLATILSVPLVRSIFELQVATLHAITGACAAVQVAQEIPGLTIQTWGTK